MYQADMKTSEKPLTNTPKDTKICMEPIIGTASDEASTNLDNVNNSALLNVQIPLEYKTPNGCQVKLTFRKESKPGVREEIARLLLDAFEERVRRQ